MNKDSVSVKHYTVFLGTHTSALERVDAWCCQVAGPSTSDVIIQWMSVFVCFALRNKCKNTHFFSRFAELQTLLNCLLKILIQSLLLYMSRMYVCMCVYVCIYVYMYAYRVFFTWRSPIHTNIHSYIDTCIHTYVRTYVHLYIHTYICTHEQGGLKLVSLKYFNAVPASWLMHACMCACMYVWQALPKRSVT